AQAGRRRTGPQRRYRRRRRPLRHPVGFGLTATRVAGPPRGPRAHRTSRGRPAGATIGQSTAARAMGPVHPSDPEVHVEHLLRLVDNLDTLRASWERAPFLSRGLDPFDDVFSIDTIQHILDGGAPVTSVRLFQGQGLVPAEHITRPRDPNAR